MFNEVQDDIDLHDLSPSLSSVVPFVFTASLFDLFETDASLFEHIDEVRDEIDPHDLALFLSSVPFVFAASLFVLFETDASLFEVIGLSAEWTRNCLFWFEEVWEDTESLDVPPILSRVSFMFSVPFFPLVEVGLSPCTGLDFFFKVNDSWSCCSFWCKEVVREDTDPLDEPLYFIMGFAFDKCRFWERDFLFQRNT